MSKWYFLLKNQNDFKKNWNNKLNFTVGACNISTNSASLK
jgi:hypothetical protein